MQKKKNDVKATTTLLLSLSDEHQLRFSKYKTARELWAVILKTFGGNEATKKTKKNLLKQQYGNFRAEGSETLDQTSDLDTMSLDDLYNHLKIDEDDMEEMDIKWNMALLSMSADNFWKKTGKKISIQGSDVVRFDKSKVECFNCHKMGHFARECRAPRNQDRRRSDNYRQGSKAEERDPKALMAIDGTGLPECADDIVTDYSRPSPTIESSSEEDQNRNPSVSEKVASPITPKPFVKFVKASDSQSKSKTAEKETPRKPPFKYVEQYRKPNKKPNVRGNQRNWNNLKSHQLGPDFVMKKKACFNCGDFNHLAYECRKRVKRGTTRSQNNTYKSLSHRPVVHRPTRSPMRSMRPNMNCACSNRTSLNKSVHSYTNRHFQRKSAVKSQYKAPWIPTVNRNFSPVNRKFSTASRNFPTVNRKFSTASRKFPTGSIKYPTADIGLKRKAGSSQNHIDNKGYWDSGCSRHMTCNISYLSDYEPFDGGYVSFGVLFIDSECIVLGRDFKLSDDGNILPRIPRQHNMYSIDLNNIVPHKDLTCLVAKASADECIKQLTLVFYVQNKVLVNKAHNKTSYELFNDRTPAIGFLKSFGCHVMILNTLDNLGKFEEKEDEGYFLGYSMSSKAFRVFNKRTKRVKENLHIEFLENKATEKVSGLNWLFDIDSLTKSMNYVPVVDVGTNSTNFLGTKVDGRQDVKKDVSSLRYIILPNWVYEEHLESTSSQPQDACNTDAPKSSGNSNPTATSTNLPAD
uniref:Retrovirus-related Pol polyprotein from transposon TNT 1-94 n=1 Tax=Tanacetum cinerariifolium TaxID=118510 RepID=A0A6L2KX22_TANCI|nr:retrovirus-related Pol polyprotein from transposon TNT 1-94 [Tanacetum cinerariifolium]